MGKRTILQVSVVSLLLFLICLFLTGSFELYVATRSAQQTFL